ncbi:MAG: DeoR/GlpR transcriptional regulator [Actinobacteria bacterium]|nr:DeoR/GlpR transcriptional regulator [Actinomycetota bacterium]MBM3712738.1 DeoR/GlpR transcriptional regulator [Actinomycetota bacterium]
MKKDQSEKMPEKRLSKMKEIIEKEEMVTVKRLSELFKITYLTVRRDLKKIEEEGFINKVYGGAILKEKVDELPIFNDIKFSHKEEKERIAEEASKRIKDGDTIVLESGTTCLTIVKYLETKKNLMVHTAYIPIFIELWRLVSAKKDINIATCGGFVRTGIGTFYSTHSSNFFKTINADIAFIGALAISTDKGISTTNNNDAELEKSVVKCAKKVILVCDSSKFNTYSHINIIPLKEIDEIITDNNLDKDIIEEIREKEIKLTLV